jgi:hypothetical protein
VSWLSVFVIVAAASKSTPSLAYPWAAGIVAFVMLSGMFSMLGLMTQRARDSDRGLLSAVLNPFTLFRRGTAGPNAYGAPPPRGRVWWFLGAAVLLGGLAYIAAGFTFDRIAAPPHCTPVVSASAATLAEAERRWRERVIATHGANYLEGRAMVGRTVCRDGVCTFSARACRRISRNP